MAGGPPANPILDSTLGSDSTKRSKESRTSPGRQGNTEHGCNVTLSPIIMDVETGRIWKVTAIGGFFTSMFMGNMLNKILNLFHGPHWRLYVTVLHPDLVPYFYRISCQHWLCHQPHTSPSRNRCQKLQKQSRVSRFKESLQYKLRHYFEPNYFPQANTSPAMTHVCWCIAVAAVALPEFVQTQNFTLLYIIWLIPELVFRIFLQPDQVNVNPGLINPLPPEEWH